MLSPFRSLKPLGFFIKYSSAKLLCGIALGGAVWLSFQGGWVGTGWNDSIRAAINHSWIIALMVAMASAIDARRYRRRFPTVNASVRGASPVLLPVLGSSFWGIASMSVVVLGAVGATAAVSAWRLPHPVLVLVGYSWILAMAGVGWLVGWILPLVVAVPAVLLVGWFANVSLAASTDRWPALLTGIDDGAFTSSIEPRTAVLIAQCLLMILVALVSVLLVRFTGLGVLQLASALAVVFALTVGSCVILGASGGARRAQVADATGPMECAPGSSSRSAICVWPDNVSAKYAASEQAARMWAPLAEQGYAVPRGVVDEGLLVPSGWIAVPLWTPIDVDIANNLARSTLTWLWCGDGNYRIQGGDEAAYTRWLWLQSQVLPIDAGSDPTLRTVLQRSSAEQTLWLQEKPTEAKCLPR